MVPLIGYIILFIVDWRLALLSLCSIPVGMIAMMLMMKDGMQRMKPYYEASKEMNSTIVEYVTGMEVIKIFNRTANSFEKYKSSIENYRKYNLEWLKSSWTHMAVYAAVLPTTVLFLLPVGTLMYYNGTVDLSTLVFSLLLSLSLGMPLLRLMEYMPLVPNLMHRMEQLEKEFQGDDLRVEDRGLIPKDHSVAFENVTFAYNQEDVIRDVSFTAGENRVTAIVGESGSGKTTLARLISHFWDVNAGSIRIGGVDIKELSFESLMNYISYVAQDSFLFDIPVMENIRLGRPGASDEEVVTAAKAAMCHDFVSKMNAGYNTMVGDAGDRLSGGEKQRIAIARAILKDAPIIVLDEATAFTDPENEDRIQEAINSLIGGKTLIVIAHHLSTIVRADNIIVMDKGRLDAQGRHEELLSGCEVYKSLWNSHLESLQWDIRGEAYAGNN